MKKYFEKYLPNNRVTFKVVFVTIVEPFFSSCRWFEDRFCSFSLSESVEEFEFDRVFFSWYKSASIEFVSLYCDGEEEIVVRVWSRSNGCSRSVYKYRSNKSKSDFWLNDVEVVKSEAMEDVSRRNRNS